MDSTKDFKNAPDRTLICSFVIPGHPATKKNSNQIIWVKTGRRRLPKVIPSSQYTKYEKHCKEYCYNAWKNQKNTPIDFGIAIRIKVWLSAWRLPDHVGILQSLGDIFQKWNIIADDKYIQWTDYNFDTKDTDMWLAGVDKENPRVEVFIYRYRHTVEHYDDIKAEKAEKIANKSSAKKTATKKTPTKKAPRATSVRAKKTKDPIASIS